MVQAKYSFVEFLVNLICIPLSERKALKHSVAVEFFLNIVINPTPLSKCFNAKICRVAPYTDMAGYPAFNFAGYPAKY